MKISITFHHYVSKIPPRCRKARWVPEEETTTVNIKEVQHSDLKLAFVVRDFYSEDVIFSYKNKLFKKVYKEAENETSPMLIEDLMKYFERFSRIDYNTQTSDEIKKELRETARSYLIVGGCVFEQIGEPRYCIYTFGLGHNHGSTHFTVTHSFNPNIHQSRYFNALEYEDAVKTAKEIALKRGDTESIDRIDKYAFIDVVDKNYVKCNPQKKHKCKNNIIQTFEEVIESSSSKEDAQTKVIATAMSLLQ